MALCQFSKMAIPRQLRAIPHFVSFFSSPISRSPLRAASKQLLKSDFLERNISTTRLCRADEKNISITFVSEDGEKRIGKGKVGDTLYDVMINNGIQFEDFDSSAVIQRRSVCTICHMVFRQEDYDNLPTKPTDNELFNLDCMIFEKTSTSRLGCVIQLTEGMDGLEVKVPEFEEPYIPGRLHVTVMLADFIPSLRDSCRYKCLNIHKPVLKWGGKSIQFVMTGIAFLIMMYGIEKLVSFRAKNQQSSNPLDLNSIPDAPDWSASSD